MGPVTITDRKAKSAELIVDANPRVRSKAKRAVSKDHYTIPLVGKKY